MSRFVLQGLVFMLLMFGFWLKALDLWIWVSKYGFLSLVITWFQSQDLDLWVCV